ncbi:polypyrimidine tract-binding protein 3 [Rhynochetos jubatus]
MSSVDVASFCLLVSTKRPFTMNNSNSNTDTGRAKKFKGKRLPCPPSRVIHISNIPADVSEAEVISLGLPFGKVTNFLMLKGKGQALLEMACEEDAVSMMKYYAVTIVCLHSKPICIRYSDYKELNTDNHPNQARVQAALHAMQDESQTVARYSVAESEVFQGYSSVLRVIIENSSYPITLEFLHQIFSKYGSVLRIVTYTKNNQFHALLEYADIMNAYYAKMALDGQNITSICCALRVDFCSIDSLKVKYNNDRSRDFTCSVLPSGGGQLMETSVTPAIGTQNNVFPAYQGQVGLLPPVNFSQDSGVKVADTTPSVPEEMTPPSVADVPGNAVLLVRNLNPDVITPDRLFILFGVYGDVLRVKIMFKNKEMALVQMADTTQAQLAIGHLNGQMLYGRALHTTFSKYQTVQLPAEGLDAGNLTKDYSNSPLHRFKKPGSKSFQNVFPPSATLHLAKIPSFVTEDDLKKLFRSTGSTVKAVKFFQKYYKMALIQLGSVEEAVHALIELHDYDLGANHRLRISFSKNAI